MLQAGEVSTLDLLALLVSTRHIVGSGDQVGWIEGFDAEWAGQFVDVKASAGQLVSQIRSAGDVPKNRRVLRATMRNRRKYVLAWLKREHSF